MKANLGFILGMIIFGAIMYFKLHIIFQIAGLFIPFVFMLWFSDDGFGGNSDWMADGE